MDDKESDADSAESKQETEASDEQISVQSTRTNSVSSITTSGKDTETTEGFETIGTADTEAANSETSRSENVPVMENSPLTLPHESTSAKDLLNDATASQNNKTPEISSVDLLNETLTPESEDEEYEEYWKRMCLKEWQACDIWRYSDSWKSMYVHRTVQNAIETFDPNQSDTTNLLNRLTAFSGHTTKLKIQKLVKVKEKEISIDLSSEDFDDQLDNLIAEPLQPIYLDFEKLFEFLPRLRDVAIMLTPKCLDYHSFHLSIPDFKNFFSGLCKLEHLRKLRISNATATNEQIIEILKMASNHKALFELDLSFNFIDSSVCDYIGKLLISKCPLRTLILKNNKISNNGVKIIAAALSQNSKLRKLDLSLNMIENDGGCFLANAMQLNETLVDLDISKNKMTSGVGSAVSEVIKNSSSLRRLKIQENLLGEASGNLFKNAMNENSCLLELDIHFCGFSHEDEGSIYEYIIRNRSKVSYSSYRENMNITAAEFLF